MGNVRREGLADSVTWQRYDVWNQTLAGALFTSANEGRPVYLDMDDEVLTRVALEGGMESAEASAQLADSVRSTLDLNSTATGVFEKHLRNLRTWRRVAIKKSRDEGAIPEAPPVLGLLAALTLAAEEMQHDGEFAGNAYYPRLFRVLRIADAKQQSRFMAAYRKHAEELWGGLNEWLYAADGRLGLPTAYAFSHRYVGLPLSQALVRSVDRRQFPLMFHRFGLPPGGEVSPDDMERLLDNWLQMRPCPVSRSLESLWQRGQARQRIASVAAVELRNWDGAISDSDSIDGRSTGSVQLLSWLRRFPRRRLDLSFVVNLGTHTAPQTLTVLTAAGEPSVEVLPVANSRLQPVFTTETDTASLVEGVLRLTDSSRKVEVARFPRRVVPFRRDDLLNAFVECERVQLGEDSMLLVKDDRGLPDLVRAALAQIARPGFREETGIAGMPVGWVLFAEVQIVATPEAESTSDLNALIPLLSSKLALAGGTKLPGSLRKWSTLDPPEVRAVVQSSSGVTVTVGCLDKASDMPGLPRTWTSDEPTLVVDLGALALPDGDYEISLLDCDKTAHQSVLRLRSSNTPDAARCHAAMSLGHVVSSNPLSVLGASSLRPATPADVVVRGPSTAPHRTSPATTVAAGTEVWWNAPKPPTPPPQRITLTALDPASCVVTGAHHIELPPANGQAKGGLISGVCKNCGLIKRYPARIRWHRDGSSRRSGPKEALRVHVNRLSEVAPRDADWDAAVDSLVYAQGGSYHDLVYIADQVEGSSLFTDTFSRSLEARGDLEIERAADFAPSRWEMSPAYLVELATGDFLVTGCWSRDDREELRELVDEAGGALTIQRDQGLQRHLVAGLSAASLGSISDTIGTAGVVPDAAARLVGELPPLGKLEAALPRVPVPATRSVRQFHLESASWVPVLAATEPGAYRLERAFERTYVFRTPADVETGTSVLTTAQLGKHLAARRSGRALVAYSSQEQVLAVPLGADLPGLYGRAAVLCSGRLPVPDAKRRMLTYHDVPKRVADMLTTLLTS